MSDILFLKNVYFCQLHGKQKIDLYGAGFFLHRRNNTYIQSI
jgi:hypothetical protein